MKTIIIPIGIISLIFFGYQIGQAQSDQSTLKFEINSVYEIPRFSNRRIPTESSGRESYRYIRGGANLGIETGLTYQFREQHALTARLGFYFLTSGSALVQPRSGLQGGRDPIFYRIPPVYNGVSTRLELSHRYKFYDKEKVQVTLNSGVGLRYWSWNSTSEVTSTDFSPDSEVSIVGEYTSYTIRPLHPDLNLGLSLIIRELFTNVDVFAGFTFIFSPLSVYRVDPLRLQNNIGIVNEFQFDNRISFQQIRVGVLFSVGRKGVKE